MLNKTPNNEKKRLKIKIKIKDDNKHAWSKLLTERRFSVSWRRLHKHNCWPEAEMLQHRRCLAQKPCLAHRVLSLQPALRAPWPSEGKITFQCGFCLEKSFRHWKENKTKLMWLVQAYVTLCRRGAETLQGFTKAISPWRCWVQSGSGPCSATSPNLTSLQAPHLSCLSG